MHDEHEDLVAGIRHAARCEMNAADKEIAELTAERDRALVRAEAAERERDEALSQTRAVNQAFESMEAARLAAIESATEGWQAQLEWQKCAEEALANLTRLREAVAAVYYAAKWSADRPVDEAKLWTNLRDAAGFTPGRSPKEPTE